MSAKARFMPLQKIEVITGIAPITAGSIGFINWIDMSKVVTIRIVFIRYGKKGKDRIALNQITSNVYENVFTQNIKLTDMNILSSGKDIIKMTTMEFIGFITAFSLYLSKLQNKTLGEAGYGAIDVIAFLNNPTNVNILNLGSIILKVGNDCAQFNNIVSLCQNIAYRKSIMELLYMTMSGLAKDINNNSKKLMDSYNLISKRQDNPLAITPYSNALPAKKIVSVEAISTGRMHSRLARFTTLPQVIGEPVPTASDNEPTATSTDASEYYGAIEKRYGNITDFLKKLEHMSISSEEDE